MTTPTDPAPTPPAVPGDDRGPDDRPAGRPLALVTGASSGIGYELALQFAEHGHDLVIAAEDEAVAEAAGNVERLGVDVRGVRVDLSTYEGVEQLYREATADGRVPDVVALNAGTGTSGDFARDTDLRDELRTVNLNVASVVHLAKLASRDMVARGSGRILITSSTEATTPGPYQTVYAASKAFDLSFAQGLRSELQDTGVTVTALLPGPTDTPFFDKAGLQDTKIGQLENKDDPADVAEQAFEALMAGKDKLVAGSLRNRVQAVAGRVLPETTKAEAHRRLAAPGSGDQ